MLSLLGAGQGQNDFSPYDSSYQLILNKATALGYSLPSDTQKIIQNNLVLALKSAGIWNKLDVLYIFANDGGSNFATLNWINPNIRRCLLFTSGSTLTFTTNQGFTGNGTSAYIDTTFVPISGSGKYQATNASRYVYLYAPSVAPRPFDGNSINGSNTFGTYSNATNNLINGSTVASTFIYSGTQQMKSIHKTSTTSITMFNGTTIGSGTSLSASLANASQFILRSGGLYASHQVSMYAMGESLITENTDFVNAFNTYITSL
jgi:hypothetical protein